MSSITRRQEQLTRLRNSKHADCTWRSVYGNLCARRIPGSTATAMSSNPWISVSRTVTRVNVMNAAGQKVRPVSTATMALHTSCPSSRSITTTANIPKWSRVTSMKSTYCVSFFKIGGLRGHRSCFEWRSRLM